MDTSQLSNCVMMDGLIILGKGLKFLGKYKSLNLPRNVVIKIVDANGIKGVQCLRNSSTCQVTLGELIGGQMSVILFHRYTDEDIDNGVRNFRISYNIIRQAFVKSVDSAIDQLLASSFTKKHWISQTFNRYADWVGKKNNAGNPLLKIFAEDVPNFGELLQINLEQELQPHGYEVLFCIQVLGQNIKLSRAKKIMETFRTQYASEIVVHLARDFQGPGTYTTWNREKSVDMVGKSPKYEFYPCFTGGSGNFTFDIPLDYRDEDEEYEENTVKGVNLKLYNSAFKELHRNFPGPFKHPKVVNILSDGSIPCGIRQNETEMMRRWIAAIERSIENQRTENCVTARLETIMTVTDPDDDVFYKIRRFFKEKYGDEYKRCLDTTSFVDYSIQLRRTLIPSLATLKDVLDNQDPDCLPDLETCTVAAICEALICFAVYGKTSFFLPGSDSHSLKLKNTLKLYASTFANSKDLFHGLGFTKDLFVINGRLNYTGELFFDVSLYGKVAKHLEQRNIDFLRITLSNLKNCASICKDQLFKDLASMIYLLIFKFSNIMLCQESGYDTFNRDRATDWVMKRRLTYPMSSKEFVNWLFSSSADVNNVRVDRLLYGVLRTTKKRINLAFLGDFSNYFAGYIERKLYASNEYVMLYPVNNYKESYWISILALYRLDVYGYSLLRSTDRLKMENVYRTIFKKLYNVYYDVETSNVLREVNEMGWIDCDVGMKQVFGKIFQRFMLEA